MASGYQAGSAYSLYSLDLSQFDRDVARVKREIAGLQAEAAKARAPTNVPRGNGGDGSTADQRSADAALRLTQARANLARANGDEARALQILNDGLAKNANATETASLRVQTAAARLKNGTTYAQEFGQAVKSNLLSIVGPAALAGAAFAAVGKGVELGKSALALNRTIALTKELTGTQAAYDRVIAAARQQQLLYGGSLQENIAGIQGLVVTARSTGAELTTLIGLSQRLAVLDPAQGAEGARIALSEVLSGDPRSLSRRYEIPLAALEKIKDTSLPVADRLKVLDQYLDKIGITANIAGKVVSEEAKTYNRLGAVVGDVSTKIGTYLAKAGAPVASALADIGGAIDGTRESFIRAAGAAPGFLQQLQGFGPPTAAAAAQQRAFAESMVQGADELLRFFGLLQPAAAATAEFTDIESIRAQRAVDGGSAISGALQQELSDKIAAEQKTADLALVQSQLDADSRAAAQGLLGAGDQALVLANKYGIAADAAQFLIQQQQRLIAGQALADQRAGERNPGASGAAEVAAQEERRLQALYRTLQDPPEKARKGRGPKLSDQQKLNNSLLADQDKANDRFEDAQIKHEQAMLKIEKDFAAKSLDAQKKNESDKRRSRSDFYKNLSKDTATIGQAAAADLSAQYEAAFAESQRLAQAGNQVQAREFLALRKEQIAADQEYYRDRAEAQKQAKDGESKAERDAAQAEIGRLDNLRALEKDAQAEDLKQLLEGGDQLQNDKAAALQNENAQYEQSQSKIELASDRATEHKITNAQRAGKAIEAENALLIKQSQILQSLPGGSGAVPTNGALPATADTPATAGAAAAALMAVVDTALLGAVQAQTSMQIEKFDAVIGRLDAVERAVRSVRGMGSVAA